MWFPDIKCQDPSYRKDKICEGVDAQPNSILSYKGSYPTVMLSLNGILKTCLKKCQNQNVTRFYSVIEFRRDTDHINKNREVQCFTN